MYSTNESIAGKGVRQLNDYPVRVLPLPDKTKGAMEVTVFRTEFGRTTGKKFTDAKGIVYYQVTLYRGLYKDSNGYWHVADIGSTSATYVAWIYANFKITDAVLNPTKSLSDKELVVKIVDLDNNSTKHLLLAKEKLQLAKSKGLNIDKYVTDYNNISNNISARKRFLQDKGYVRLTNQVGTKWDQLMVYFGLGELTTLTIISLSVIAGIFIASPIVYWLLKPSHEEAIYINKAAIDFAEYVDKTALPPEQKQEIITMYKEHTQ